MDLVYTPPVSTRTDKTASPSKPKELLIPRPEPKKEKKTLIKPKDKGTLPRENKKEETEQEKQPAPSLGLTLESSQFPYAYYLRMIQQRVSNNWYWSDYGQGRQCVVYFRIQPSGNITDVSLNKDSNDGFFDQAALRAIALSTPFPPLPEGFKEPYLGVFFEFNFRE